MNKMTISCNAFATKPAVICKNCNRSNALNLSCLTCSKKIFPQRSLKQSLTCLKHHKKCVKCGKHVVQGGSSVSQCLNCNNGFSKNCCFQNRKQVVEGETKEKSSTSTSNAKATSDEKLEVPPIILADLREKLQVAVDNKNWTEAESLIKENPFLASSKVYYTPLNSNSYNQKKEHNFPLHAVLQTLYNTASDQNEPTVNITPEAMSLCKLLCNTYHEAILSKSTDKYGRTFTGFEHVVRFGIGELIELMLNTRSGFLASSTFNKDYLPLHLYLMSSLKSEECRKDILEMMLKAYPLSISIPDKTRWQRIPIKMSCLFRLPFSCIKFLAEQYPEGIEWSPPRSVEMSTLSLCIKKGIYSDEKQMAMLNSKQKFIDSEGKETNEAKETMTIEYNQKIREFMLNNVHSRNVKQERLQRIYMSVCKDILREDTNINLQRWSSFVKYASNSCLRSNVTELMIFACEYGAPSDILESLINLGAKPSLGFTNQFGEEKYALHTCLKLRTKENFIPPTGRVSDKTLEILARDDNVLRKQDCQGNTVLHLVALLTAPSKPFKNQENKIIIPKVPLSLNLQLLRRMAKSVSSILPGNDWPLNSRKETPLWTLLKSNCEVHMNSFPTNFNYLSYYENQWLEAYKTMKMLLECQPTLAGKAQSLYFRISGSGYYIDTYPLEFLNFSFARSMQNQRKCPQFAEPLRIPSCIKETLWKYMIKSFSSVDSSGTQILMNKYIPSMIRQSLVSNMFDKATPLIQRLKDNTFSKELKQQKSNELLLHLAIIHGAPSHILKSLIELYPVSLTIGVNVGEHGNIVRGETEKSDLPLHLIFDDVHNRPHNWSCSTESVLVILDGYKKHCQDLISRGNNIGQYVMELCGFKANTEKSQSQETNSQYLSVHRSSMGCPLQMELARIGHGRDLGIRSFGYHELCQKNRSHDSFLRLGPRWEIVEKLVSMYPYAVQAIRHIYEDKQCLIKNASKFLSRITGCCECLPLHRCLALGAPEHIVLAVLQADVTCAKSTSAMVSQDNVLHLAVSNHHSSAVIEALLTANPSNAKHYENKWYCSPIILAMHRLNRQYKLLTGISLSKVELFYGDSVCWKMGDWAIRNRLPDQRVLFAKLLNESNDSQYRSLYLPPQQFYPGTPIIRASWEALKQHHKLPYFIVQCILHYLDEKLYSTIYEGSKSALPENIEYFERFDFDKNLKNLKNNRIPSLRELRLKRITNLMRSILILIPANPYPMYDSDENSGKKYIEVFRETMVNVRAIRNLSQNSFSGENSKSEERNETNDSAAIESFQPLGRRSFSSELEALHMNVEALVLCALEESSVSRSYLVEAKVMKNLPKVAFTSRRFTLEYLVKILQSLLQNELVLSLQNTSLLRNVYSANYAGHRGMYESALNGIKVQPQYAPFMDRADQLALSIQKSRRRESKIGDGEYTKKTQKGGLNIFSLYVEAHNVKQRYEHLLENLANRTGAVYMHAPMKKPLRVLEKAMIETARVVTVDGMNSARCWDTSCVLDVVRGALSFSSMNEMLMCLELLCATTTNKDALKEANDRGWNAKAAGIEEKLDIVRIKNRFKEPTSGGWSDTLINFRFSGTAHICEIQFVHSQMMLVRKQMGAHFQYEQFRSASELLEATGHEDIVRKINSTKRMYSSKPKKNGLEKRVVDLEKKVEMLMQENDKLWKIIKKNVTNKKQ